jgi:hypothetical protein
MDIAHSSNVSHSTISKAPGMNAVILYRIDSAKHMHRYCR